MDEPRDLGHRPKFLNCIMPPGVISRIRENQDFYDKDPEDYERREKEREEEKYREEQEERDYFNRTEEDLNGRETD